MLPVTLTLPHQDRLDPILCSLLEDAKRRGADYADVRYARYRLQSVSVRDRLVEAIEDDESVGVGIRVLAAGGWGFASTPDLSADSLAEALVHQVLRERGGCLSRVGADRYVVLLRERVRRPGVGLPPPRTCPLANSRPPEGNIRDPR